MAHRSLSLAQSQLYADQVVLLYRHAPLAYVITLIAGVVLILVQRPYIALPILLGW